MQSNSLAPRLVRVSAAPFAPALAAALLVVTACDSLGKPKVAQVQPARPPTMTPDGSGGGTGSAIPPPTLPDPPAPAANPGITLGDGGAAPTPSDAAPVDDGTVVVYAHSGSDLFKVDPQSLQVTRVGPFVVRGGVRDRFLNNVTDIALDKGGKITGITFNELLDIDSATGDCRVIAPLRAGGSMNGLSWIRTEGGEEFLAATGTNGTVLRIDPATGESRPVGNLGGGLRSSGDLVSVANYGTLLTLRGEMMPAMPGMPPREGSDVLARVDPVTGVATPIGPTNFRRVYGVGFWGNRVFGFTDAGEFILIDPRTGAGTLVQKFSAFPFWGAGVSTAVPVVD